AADTMADRYFGLAKEGKPGSAYAHTQFLDGLYHEGLPIAHFIGGDGRSYSIGVNLTPEQNAYPLRYGFRFLPADVNPGPPSINRAFPVPDRITLGEAFASWEMRAFGLRDIKMHLGVSILRSHNSGNDTGAKIGIEVPIY